MDGRLDRRSLLRAGGAALLAGAAGCIEFDRETTERASLTFDAAGPLIVDATNGDVTVRAGDGDGITVEAVERTTADDALLDRVTVEGTSVDAGFRIAPTYGSDRARRRVAVDLTVDVPEGVTLTRAQTENGDLTARDVVGDATLETMNGDVTARNVDGAIRAGTVNGDVTAEGCAAVDRAVSTNGDVDVEVLSMPGDSEFESTNGDVAVGVDPGIDAHVVLRATNGEVTVEGVRLSEGSRDGSHVEGSLNDGGPNLSARSENGDVTLSAL